MIRKPTGGYYCCRCHRQCQRGVVFNRDEETGDFLFMCVGCLN